MGKNKDIDPKEDNFSNEVRILINAMSVGFHLKKILQAGMKPMTKEEWDYFTGWAERHKIKE